MKKLFDPDSPILRFLTQAAELAWLNILWVVCSLPVFTLGASTAALCTAVRNMIRESGHWNSAAFFRAFRDNFKKSTLLWLILLAALALLGADVYILRALFPEQLFWLVLPGVCFALWLMVFIWAFPLTATFENTLWNTIKNAVLLGVGYLTVHLRRRRRVSAADASHGGHPSAAGDPLRRIPGGVLRRERSLARAALGRDVLHRSLAHAKAVRPLPAGRSGMTGQTSIGKCPLRTNLRRGHF